MSKEETTEDIFNEVCDELEDEIERSDAYRSVAISLIDQLACNAVADRRKARMEESGNEGPKQIMTIAPDSGTIH